eukprot:8893946-Heterocapsa_arctica.AAC.1
MLGDVHPVCGFPNAKSKDQCELMLLSQPHGATPGMYKAMHKAPCLVRHTTGPETRHSVA